MTTAGIVSLCSGYGGLDLAVEAVLDAHTTHVADIDRDACTVLAHRFPDAPNLGDLRAVDWTGIHADILTAGYPCQPFSHAGRRQGEQDDRHIWPEVLRAIRALRPGLVVLENVRGHLSLGFGRVLGDLAEAGFDAEWCLLRASDVGAPHGRARVFVVAHPHGRRQQGVEEQHGTPQQDPTDRDSSGRHAHRCGVEAASHADGQAGDATRRAGGQVHEPGAIERSRRRDCVDSWDWRQFTPAVVRWERLTGRSAPAPLNGKQLNARFVEWMMGLPEGWVTDLVPNRRALHTLGNGVVPQQAAAALRSLVAA